MIDPIALAQSLIRCPSVTPEDAGALGVLQNVLENLGFECHRLVFSAPDTPDVDNLFAVIGKGGPHFSFAGHTDVVPPGARQGWTVDPFAAEIQDGWLYGRGAVDMKGAIAAFVAAVAYYQASGKARAGRISLIITGDEEGPAVNGTVKMLDWMSARGLIPDACLVGEPTNPRQLGEMIKNGRRGSLTGRLIVRGIQGHVGYPHLADNPIPRLCRMLLALGEPLDKGNEAFEPSTLSITTMDVGNPASNVIPAEARAVFNIRYNTEQSFDGLQSWIKARLDTVGGEYEITYEDGARPFLTSPGPLTEIIAQAAEAVTGLVPKFSTTGGTSDARFISRYCPVAEFGLVGQTMHKIDERVRVQDIHALTRIYQGVLDRFFNAPHL